MCPGKLRTGINYAVAPRIPATFGLTKLILVEYIFMQTKSGGFLKVDKRLGKRTEENLNSDIEKMPEKFSANDAEKYINKEVKKIKYEDVEKVLNKSEELSKLFQEQGPLTKHIEEFKLLFNMIKDYWQGNYKNIPFWSIAAIVVALLYVINPLDLIPDVIPVVGYLDDAVVIAACIAMIREDINNYKNWTALNLQ
jgi:uncharacterized membrane protein YkvA (DUF1232 family)